MNFDFRKIESDYPKAFALLKEWTKKNASGRSAFRQPEIYVDEESGLNGVLELNCVDYTGIYFNPLELDFFFDEHGIYGNVEFGHENHWMYGYTATAIVSCVGYGSNNISLYKTRSAALTALWLKEFEILEQRLESEKTA